MSRKNLLIICFLGFLLRSLYIVYFHDSSLLPDEIRFIGQANSILSDATLFYRGKYANDMPFTSLFLAFNFWLSENSLVFTRLSLAFISSITIYYIALLAYEIYPVSLVATIAAITSSIYPFFIYYSSLLLSETLFLFFTVLLFRNLLSSNKSYNGLSVGVVSGLSHLTRPTLIFFLPVMYFWQFFIKKCSPKALLISILMFLTIVAPWGVRNMVVLGEFKLSSTGSGQVLWEGNNPWNLTGGVSGDFQDPDAYLEGQPGNLSELEEDNWKKQQAVTYITNNPLEFIKLSILKFQRFWNIWPNSTQHQSGKYKLISFVSFVPILALSLLSIWIFRKEFSRLSILYLFIAYYTLIHMLTIGSIRYRLPLEPILIALASATAVKLWSDFKKRSNGST